MLAELLMATQVIASTGDHYHVPQAERSVLEARCYEREVRFTEERGRMDVAVDGKVRHIGDTAFARSYASGSYLGRFTVACRTGGGGFTLSFFGVDIPREGAIATAAGSLTYDAALTIVRDTAIAAQDLNLHRFNKNRNDRWLP